MKTKIIPAITTLSGAMAALIVMLAMEWNLKLTLFEVLVTLFVVMVIFDIIGHIIKAFVDKVIAKQEREAEEAARAEEEARKLAEEAAQAEEEARKLAEEAAAEEAGTTETQKENSTDKK